MLKILKVLVSLTLAVVAAMAGVFAVAMMKALVPLFSFTEGTKFQAYVQDPILYTAGPLYFGYMAFRGVRKWFETHPKITSAVSQRSR